MNALTTRQQEILDRLDKGLSAQEIATELDVSRNAVYQQIQAIRKKGALAPGYTPSGAPAREQTPYNEPVVVRQARLIADIADEMEAWAKRLRDHIGA